MKDDSNHLQHLFKGKENDSSWQALTSNSPDHIVIIDRDLIIKYVNRPSPGLTIEGLLGTPITDYLPDNEKEMVRKVLHRVFETEIPDRYETSFPIPDGTTIYYESQAVPLKIEHQMIGLSIHARDITHIKTAEMRIVESEQKHKRLVHNIPGMVYKGNADWSAEFISGYREICGYSSQELNSRESKWISIIHPEDREKVFTEGSVLQEKQMDLIQYYRIIDKTGKVRWVEDRKTSRFSEGGSFLGIDGVVFDITERKEMEASLRISEEKFRTLFEHSPISTVVSDLEGKILACNEQFTDMHGTVKGPEDQIGKNVMEFFPEEEWPYLRSNIEKTIHSETSLVNTDYTMLREDGTRFPAETKSTVIRNAQGKPLFLLAHAQDISTRKDAENRQKLVIDMLEILNRSHQGGDDIEDVLTLIRDHTGFEAIGIRISIGNDYPYYLTKGFPSNFVEEESTLCIRDENNALVRGPDDEIKLECLCGLVIRGKIDPNKSYCTEGGSFWTNSTSQLLSQLSKEGCNLITRQRCVSEGYESLALIPLRSGTEIIGLLQFNDFRKNLFTREMIEFYEGIGASIGISLDRKRTEKALRESEMLLNEVGKLANIGGWEIDLVERTARWTKGTYDIMEIESHKSIPGPYEHIEYYPKEFRFPVEDAMKRLIENDEPLDIESKVNTAKGNTIWVRIVGRGIRSEGKCVKIFGTLQNITDRKISEEEKKLLEAQVIQQQKLESIGTLASGVAHEINNPLMGMVNYAELIHDRVKDETLKDFSHGILKEGDRVAKIVRNLLSFSRNAKEDFHNAEVTELIEVVHNLIDSGFKKDQITMEMDIPADLPQLYCDSQQIEQVILNLLTNARDSLNQKYNGYHPKKRVNIKVRSFEDEGTWIRVTVEDLGVGIPVAIIDRVFDPFFTTKDRTQGTGLG